MRWNWQQPDWPRFTWRPARLAKAEAQFLHASGVLVGVVKHLAQSERDQLIVEAMSDEAVTTSEIEGEILDRQSVQSSIRRDLGLAADPRRVGPAERGIGDLMVDLFRGYAAPLDKATLGRWHAMVMNGRHDLRTVGEYRTHGDPMQVVSGRLDVPTVHFEAPPAARVPGEMAALIGWFNACGPGGDSPLGAVTRAGVAHLYFESIHPFEDGNGRIGRAISEKALAQGVARPTMTALAATILARRREYYDALGVASRANEITPWLAWFAGVGLEAQMRTVARVEFLLDKARLLRAMEGRMSARQEKALVRTLREGPEGFAGGLTAGKYSAITRASAATATRDLAGLVEAGALVRSGSGRHTRYELAIPLRPVPRVEVDEAGEVVMG